MANLENARDLGQGVYTKAEVDGITPPSGGTTGQVLTKASNSDNDTEWTTPTEYVTTGKAIAMAIVFG
jgi:hypothetical protein